MRMACRVASITLAMLVVSGQAALATPFVASSAYLLSADLTYRGVTTIVHPVGRISGAGSPPYRKTDKIAGFDEALRLNPVSLFGASVQIDAKKATTVASARRIGTKGASATGSAHIGSIGLSLTSGALFPTPLFSIADLIDLSVTAKNVRSDADYSIASGSGRVSATGDASFGSLVLSGALVGGRRSFSGDAAPNTVIFSTSTVTVTLDKKFETELISCSLDCRLTPYSITTEAIDISLDNARVFGQRISGDIVIGQSYADPPAPVAEPAALVLIMLGVAATPGMRHRTGGRHLAEPAGIRLGRHGKLTDYGR